VRAHELWGRFATGFTAVGIHTSRYFNVPRGAELYARYTGDPTAVHAARNTDLPCPILAADLGRPEKLGRRLGEVERILSNAHKRIDTPWWALRTPNYDGSLLAVCALSAAERARSAGREVRAIRGGQLKWWGDMDILFLEEKDREHAVEVTIIKTTDPPPFEATLCGPAGAVIFKKSFSTKDLPKITHGNVLRLKISKDGRKGHYLLRLRGLKGAYMRSWISKGPPKRLFLFKRPQLSLGAFNGTRFWFLVPKDCARFRLGGKPGNRASRFGFTVSDARGRPVGGKAWYYDSHRDRPTTRWLDLTVPPAARGTWWGLAYACRKNLAFTWPKELPAYITDGPTSGFIPDAAYLKRALSAK